MRRIGINILLVGVLIVGLGGAGYLLPFVVPLDVVGVELFETVVLFCWGIGAALVLISAVVAGLRKMVPRT